ncbi:MAG TPA: hypothetical protein VK808_11200 [Bacteroidia bacterium]|nr:hypothetical protein [Bacteroidia bacterium]
MSDILFCLFYILLFSVIILRNKWFSSAGFSNKYFLGVFYLKLLFGVALYFIYTHIYKNRITSDIFKYYDDSKMMFGTLHTSMKDYFTLLTGIGDSDIHYQAMYHSMSSWDNGYDSNLYNNSHFIIRLNAIFLLLSNGHYGVHVIFMCFIALVGLTYVYKSFIPFLKDKSKFLFAAVFLFPSVILWSSGILKEGFVWLGLGLSIYYFFQLTNTKFSIKYLILILIGFMLLFEAKAYILICLIPCFIAQLLIKKNTFCNKHPFLIYVSVLLLYLGSAFLPHVILHKVNPLQMIADKQTDFNRIIKGGIHLEQIKYGKIKEGNVFAFISVMDSVNIIPLNAHADSLLHRNGIQYLASNPVVYKEWTTSNKIPFMLKRGTPFSSVTIGKKDTLNMVASDSTVYWVFSYIETANSRIKIEPIEPRISSLLAHIPSALNVALILPYPWQLGSAMQIIYWGENIFVLLLFIIALFFIKRPLANKDLILFCFFYSFMMLVLIGLVTPILGGIERYKSVVIPFMFILLLLITKTSEKPIVKNEK